MINSRLAHNSHLHKQVGLVAQAFKVAVDKVWVGAGDNIDLSMRRRRRQLICISCRMKLAPGGSLDSLSTMTEAYPFRVPFPRLLFS